MLERLYVDNYRCMVNFECRFGPKQLILGPNGGGKSTLLDVLALLRDFCVWGWQADQRLSGYTRTRWHNVAEQSFEIDVSGNGGLYIFRLTVDSWGSPERPRVLKEELYFSGKPLFRFAQGEVHLFNDQHAETVHYPFDWSRSALATITDRPENQRLSWFKQWLGNLIFISPDPHQMSSLAVTEVAGPTRNLSNFAAWYRHLRLESDDDHKLLADLREVIPGFKSMMLKDVGMAQRLLFISIFPAPDDKPYTLNELSDGQRVLIGLYTVLHYALRSDRSVFFDEPDNFISLQEIQPWLDKVLDRIEDADANSQVIIISHHPELLNRLAFQEGQEGLYLDRPEGRHTRARAFSDPAQTGLSPAELVTRGWNNE